MGDRAVAAVIHLLPERRDTAFAAHHGDCVRALAEAKGTHGRSSQPSAVIGLRAPERGTGRSGSGASSRANHRTGSP